MVKWNGEKTLVPPQLELKLNEAWAAMDARRARRAGRQYQLHPQRRTAQAAGLADGRYFVMLPASGGMTPLMSGGKPVIFDIVRVYAASQANLVTRAR